MEGNQIQMAGTPIPSGFIIKERIDGIVNDMGKAAGLEQNWGYKIIDTENKECILLYCNPGIYTIIDNDSLDKIRNVNGKKVSWFVGKNGYVGCRTVMNGKDTVLTLHQHLTGHYGHGRGKESIDHINRDKLDNRMINLRVTTQSIQNENRDKVRRHKSAKELPDEIKDITLPKFVVYYKEKVSGDTYREFFTVEGHPLQKEKEKGTENSQTAQLKSRRWATTKSNRVSITSKLESAKLYINELDLLCKDSSYKMKEIEAPILDEPRKTGLKLIDKEKEIKSVIEEIKKDQEEIISNIVIIPDKKDEDVDDDEILKMKIIMNSSEKDETTPHKQWKSRQIYDAIIANTENTYKEHCEANNDLSKVPTWETDWIEFVLSVKGRTFEDTEKRIKNFVENLRRIRHNALCYKKNSKLIEKDERQQWPATTVVRAFLEGKIDKFKEFTENAVGDNPEDPKWQKRWGAFIESLESHKDNPTQLKALCSKFMTSQRTKKYRRS
jgi:hypothetical protein